MPGEDKLDLSKDPSFTQLMQTVRGLVTIVQTQGAALNQMRTTLANPPTKGSKNDKDDDDDTDEVDVDKLSNKEFMSLMMKNVGSLLDEKIGGVTKQIDGVVSTVRTKDLTAEYNELKGKHKDFGDWEDEMKALSKENPTLSLKRLYTLARQENADKAKTLDEKYEDKKDEPEDKGLTLFGGYRPTTKTGGGDGKDGDGKKTKLDMDQALDKAWDEAVAKVPALGKMEDALD